MQNTELRPFTTKVWQRGGKGWRLPQVRVKTGSDQDVKAAVKHSTFKMRQKNCFVLLFYVKQPLDYPQVTGRQIDKALEGTYNSQARLSGRRASGRVDTVPRGSPSLRSASRGPSPSRGISTEKAHASTQAAPRTPQPSCFTLQCLETLSETIY